MYSIKVNCDKDYPRFFGDYFRRRWSWSVYRDDETFATDKGDAAFKWSAKFHARASVNGRRYRELQRIKEGYEKSVKEMKRLYTIDTVVTTREVR